MRSVRDRAQGRREALLQRGLPRHLHGGPAARHTPIARPHHRQAPPPPRAVKRHWGKIAPERACKPGLATRRVFSNLPIGWASRSAASRGGFIILACEVGALRCERDWKQWREAGGDRRLTACGRSNEPGTFRSSAALDLNSIDSRPSAGFYQAAGSDRGPAITEIEQPDLRG